MVGVQGEAREECGVFGVWAPKEDVAKLTYFGLFALQHRGQEGAGIAVGDKDNIVVFKDTGLVSQVFDETVLDALQGDVAIGHTRYSTAGGNSWENVQPMFRTSPNGTDVALAPVDPRTVIPGLRHDWTLGVSEPSCAYIDVAALHADRLAAARRAGAVVMTDAGVESARRAHGRWEIATPAGPVAADTGRGCPRRWYSSPTSLEVR